MSNQQIPNEAPPSYYQATGTRPQDPNHLGVPGSSNNSGIPTAHRRSMEDESRPLPPGWVRTFDPATEHQFFVDTNRDPPRSIWVHPYDDNEYMSSLPAQERDRILQESRHLPNRDDIIASHTDDEDSASELPPRPESSKKGFGRKFKDKMTGTTHEQREQKRQQRAQEEQRAYEQHMRIRRAMGEALRTGQPQCIGQDRQGKDIYIEPPGYGGGMGYGSGYGYNPYGSGIYTTPNARYVRPAAPYGRPYYGGYGGGLGMPLALGMGGGLLGGMMLGGMF
ncbi:hypothetical protein K470DRAFT_258778 [Piedraia hortae CBS 480.64]|uniref:WW domain-containing protein n=1 Tax=Piedraia hortae CBS 480.64 TaxID=1314780 RepID=A0A6A7BWJ7_9PEZI|nr:hypothetical protein K470DRAFT_258778 [Piedraia hortae CBS 480.64]